MSRNSWVLAVVLLAACGVLGATGCAAQSAAPAEDMHGLKVVELHPKATPTPFPLDVHTARRAMLEFLRPEQMAAVDQELVAANQVEIARRAGLQGVRLGAAEAGSGTGAGWGYEQAVCPVFPDHLVLAYSRSNGAGDISLFSVVVPRPGSQGGHVRVIPGQRRSYSLWTPMATNALTLNDFNHMVKETPAGLSADWLTLGLCYAALAGGHVRAALVARLPEDEVYPLRRPALLEVSGKGGAVVSFSDATVMAGGSKFGLKDRAKSPVARADSEWGLTFAQNGRLLKVSHKASMALVERPVRGQATEVTGVPTKEQPGDGGVH